MNFLQKPRQQLPLQNSKKDTKGWRLRRQLCVRVFRVLEEWTSLAHSFSRGFCKMLTASFQRRYISNIFGKRSCLLCRTFLCKNVAILPGAFAPIFDFFVAGRPQKRQKLGQTRTSKSKDALCAPIVPLRDAISFQMARFLQVTSRSFAIFAKRVSAF